MGETLLKRDFEQRDVQRLRNLVSKKYGDSAQTQVGYSKVEVDYKEGDIWEEDGKTWTIKNGIRCSVSKLSRVKDLVKVPLVCPNCSKPMSNRFDKKMYNIHGKCQDCVIEYESKLKREGKYEEYVKTYINSNVITHIEEAQQFIEEFANMQKQDIVNEEGDIESIQGNVDNSKIIENWRKELEEIKEKIKS